MKYTLWLNGHLLGETRLEHRNPGGAQRMGALRPTAYGLELLPGMCGFLSAASALKQAMQKIGFDDPERDLARTMALMDSIPEGERFAALVKALSQLELREAGGERAAFHTVIITDAQELQAIADAGNPPMQVAEETPRYIISATPVNFGPLTGAVRGGAKIRVRMDPS